MLAERTPAMSSVMTRSPEGSTVRRTRDTTAPFSSRSRCSVRVEPTGCEPERRCRSRPDTPGEAEDRPAETRRPVCWVVLEVTR
jgi:hypothetical protein